MVSKLTEADYDSICSLYKTGLTTTEVANCYGISAGYTARLLKRRGILAHGKLSDAHRTQLISDYKAGYNLTELEHRYHVSRHTVRSHVLKAGLCIRSATEVRRKHTCDHTYFDHIDSERKAYWLGFVGADGYVGRDRDLFVKLSITDQQHLERLRNDLSASHPISARDYKDGSKPRVALEINSPGLVAGLNAHGVYSGKSLTHEWPHFLPDYLLAHYLRGYFDGDGCFGTRRSGREVQRQAFAHLCGSEPFLTWCRYYLQTRLGFGANKIGNSGAIHTLVYAGNRQIARFAHLLYGNATVYLPRKRQVIEHLL